MNNYESRVDKHTIHMLKIIEDIYVLLEEFQKKPSAENLNSIDT